MVIILQYIHIMNHYVTPKTNTVFYVNYVLIFFFKDWQNRLQAHDHEASLVVQ